MMQNLVWKQRTEAKDKQCKFGCIYLVRFEHIIVQDANKISFTSKFKKLLK